MTPHIKKICRAIDSYDKNPDGLTSLLTETPLCQLSEEDSWNCLCAAGMSKAVALFNRTEVWHLLLREGLEITPQMAKRALQHFTREGAICSLRLILPMLDNVDEPLVLEEHTPLSFALNGCLPVSACYDGFWRIRMNLECAKSLLDAGADWRKVTFMSGRLGLPESQMSAVLLRALRFTHHAAELRAAAGTSNDKELYTLILLLRALRLPDADPRERREAERQLNHLTNWRRDLSPLAARMDALEHYLEGRN